MEFDPNFLEAVAATGFARQYAQLCSQHPLRLDMSPCRAPASHVLRVARPIGPVEKLPGPARAFRFELPWDRPGSNLEFIIQGGTTVEVGFSVWFRGFQVLGTFAILALAVVKSQGGEAPNPPCPRPEFHSIEELGQVLAGVYRLGCLLNDPGGTVIHARKGP